MSDSKKKSKAAEQLRCISFGGETFKFEGYIALPEKKDSKDHYAVGSIKDFKSLKDDSICSVKFIYTLERIGNDADAKENFIALMSELYRVCANGALVEIKTTHEDYLKLLNDPMIVRKVNENLIKLLDANFRESLSDDLGVVHTSKALDKAGVDFMLLKTLGHFSQVALAKVGGKQYASEADIINDLSSVDCPFVATTFYLACRKNRDHDFALVSVPDIDSYRIHDTSAYNASLPEGVRGCDFEPYVLQVYNTNNDKSLFLAKQLKTYGYWELSETYTVAKILSLYAGKFDKFKLANIGSHIGWYSVFSAKFTDKVTVDAFEPTPETFAYLSNNVKINQLENRITTNNIAMSDTKGEFDFFLNSDNPGNNSFAAYEGNAEAFGAEYTKITVKADTMDNYYGDKDKSEWPNLILIDVEGHEQSVFNGAAKMFEEGFRPLIIAEFCPALLAMRGRPTYHQDLINKFNYSVYIITGEIDRSVVPTTLEYVEKAYDDLANIGGDAPFLNVMFVPDCFEIKNGSLAFKQ